MKIMSLTKLLLDDKTTVNELAKAVGQEREKRSRGYWLTPEDEQFSAAWLGVDQASAAEQPRYLRLHVSPGADLRLDELTRLFGRWENVPPEPEGDAFVVLYRYDEASLPFLGFIYVTLTGDPRASQTRVEKITIRREERL
jgi:hypothetical protein